MAKVWLLWSGRRVAGVGIPVIHLGSWRHALARAGAARAGACLIAPRVEGLEGCAVWGAGDCCGCFVVFCFCVLENRGDDLRLVPLVSFFGPL